MESLANVSIRPPSRLASTGSTEVATGGPRRAVTGRGHGPWSDRLFFSYARRDSAFALELARKLRAQGVDLWIDQLDIAAGERWDRAVEAALERCSGTLVVLSPSSVESTHVADEVSFALDEGKRILPVVLRACQIPLRLRRLQYVDFEADPEAALAKLLAVLGRGVVSLPLEETTRRRWPWVVGWTAAAAVVAVVAVFLIRGSMEELAPTPVPTAPGYYLTEPIREGWMVTPDGVRFVKGSAAEGATVLESPVRWCARTGLQADRMIALSQLDFCSPGLYAETAVPAGRALTRGDLYRVDVGVSALEDVVGWCSKEGLSAGQPVAPAALGFCPEPGS